MTQLFEKVGRRYVPWGHAQRWDYDQDVLKAGQSRLTFCAGDGLTRYTYNVRPDTAGFLAAAEIARHAMEEAMRQAAPATLADPTPYTKRQREIIERFRAEMAEAGGNLPRCWAVTSEREIAQAGIDAVREWRP